MMVPGRSSIEGSSTVGWPTSRTSSSPSGLTWAPSRASISSRSRWLSPQAAFRKDARSSAEAISIACRKIDLSSRTLSFIAQSPYLSVPR